MLQYNDEVNKIQTSIIANCEKLKVLLLKEGTRQGYPFSPFLHGSGDRQSKGLLRQMKSSLILQIENPKVVTKNFQN